MNNRMPCSLKSDANESTNTRLKNLCFAFALLSSLRWLWHSYLVLVLMFVSFVPQEYLHCLMFCFDLVNDYILDHIGILKHDDRIFVKWVLHPKCRIFPKKLKFF